MGKVGEFKWWGFAIAFVLCIGFALLMFKRFDYVQKIEVTDDKAATRKCINEVDELRAELKAVEKRLAADECKLQQQHPTKANHNSAGACVGASQ